MIKYLRFTILMVCASLAAVELVGTGEHKRERTVRRVIHFPKDRSIGEYAIFPCDQHAETIDKRALRNARGDVEVPAGMQLYLMLADEGLKSDAKPIDLSPLDRLRPTDIQAFSVQPFARVSTEELNRLRRHVSVREVLLSSLHKIDDSCLAPLEDLELLEVLQLPEAMITDKGLVHLEGLVHLQVLNLYGTKVTDSGLRHLKRMSELRQLDLRKTEVTEGGLREIQKALPNCVVRLSD